MRLVTLNNLAFLNTVIILVIRVFELHFFFVCLCVFFFVFFFSTNPDNHDS